MKFHRKKLSNGIIVIAEERDLPVISFGITNKAGAAIENSKNKGIAHFVEHMLFTGTKTRSHEDISREIEKKGGILNAFTTNEVTSFWFKLPSEHIHKGMDILIDILSFPLFDKEKFDKEKKVILEEIKMYHDMPQRHIYDKITENLYEAPLGIGIIGTKETVSSLNVEQVKTHFQKSFSPENFIVTMVGKFNFEEVCKKLENSFKGERIILPKATIKKINKNTVEEREGLDQAHFLFAFHAPLPDDKQRFALEVLNAYLANGMSSRLFLEIREKRGLAYSVQSTIISEKEYSYYTVYCGTVKESIEEIKEIILEELRKSRNMTQQDLEEAKERVIGLRKVSSEESTEVMNDLLFSEIFGKAEDYYTYEEEIKKVTLDQIRKVADIKSYSTAAIVPK